MKRPLIGLVTGLNKEGSYEMVHNGYMQALLACGAMPAALPLTSDPAALADMIDMMDGFLFTGGGDIDPRLFGEQTRDVCGAIDPTRDAMELPLARMLAARPDKPVLGICRGFQVMNVALGGTLYQDLTADAGRSVIAHRQKQPDCYTSHSVTLAQDAILAHIAGSTEISVNSLHHQAVNRLGEGMRATALAPDGIIEAAEFAGHPFYVGVQWHPERLWQNDDISVNIFRIFTNACRIDASAD